MSITIIGLKGRRQVGKSKIADHLVQNLGFTRVHPFDGGKVACRAYFMHLGADEETAWRMTDGDLKDVPSPILPIITKPEHVVPGKSELGDHYMSRFFMEKFGRCMGIDMGPDWTIGKELQLHLDANPGEDKRLVVESIVYEADQLRALGGKIIEVTRTAEGLESPVGMETDRFGATVVPDLHFNNSGASLETMRMEFNELLADHFGIGEPEPELIL
ncbi:hypothetical protein KUV57_13190 [Epibacterium sp. DP7N7-1]|nr:hypothetical protein [Epibacterium sp. DP7N7-1]